jgi:hypothetical protein
MKNDVELEVWRQQWQSGTQTPPDLIARIKRQTLFMRVHRLSEILVTIVIGGGTIVSAISTGDRYLLVLACGTCVFTFVAWWFSLSNFRDVWAPQAPTMASYVSLAIARCERRIVSIRFSLIFGLLLSVFVLTIDHQLLKEHGALGPDFWTFVEYFTIGTGLVAAFLMRIGQKASAELRNLRFLQQELTEDH